MQFLTEHPEQRRIWQDDLAGVTPTAVEEIIRYASPVVFMRRTATEDVTLSGPHFCLGAHLARRELAVAWRQLLTRLPDLEAAGPPEYLEAAGIPLVGGIKRYPVRFTPTAPVGQA